MLALKITLVPFFLLIVSMCGKWWGPSVAGWLAGLPVVAGPILFLLALEHGPAFAAHAATLALAAVLASEAFNFAYAWTCRAHPWPLALASGFAAWLLAALALSRLPATPFWAAGTALAAVCIGQSFLPRSAAPHSTSSSLTRTDVLARIAAGALLTLAVTSLAGVAGATWSGLLAVFPLLTSVLAVSSHRAHGPDFVIALLRGMVMGRFAFATFCLLVTFLLPVQATPSVFVEACVAAMFVQGCTKRMAANRRAPAQDASRALR